MSMKILFQIFNLLVIIAFVRAECPRIITREEWGAREPVLVEYLENMPVARMFIHHGATRGCNTTAECIEIVQAYQNVQMDINGWNDIAYSFLVGEDGNVYEGRGWDKVGAHTSGYNSISLAICVIGDFMDRAPNEAALNMVKAMIQCGIDSGYLTRSYTLGGHRNVGNTLCPGDALYNEIRRWPNFGY